MENIEYGNKKTRVEMELKVNDLVKVNDLANQQATTPPELGRNGVFLQNLIQNKFESFQKKSKVKKKEAPYTIEERIEQKRG